MKMWSNVCFILKSIYTLLLVIFYIFLSIKEVIKLLQPFRNVFTMSTGYLFAVGSIIIMYTLLPVIFTDLWGSKIAGVAIMIMTMLQIFLFGPLAANLVDTYGAKKMLRSYI